MSRGGRSYDPRPALELARLKARDDGWRTKDTNQHLADSDLRVAEVCGVSLRSVARWKAGAVRMDDYTADKVAINLGLHPCLIWGDDWWIA